MGEISNNGSLKFATFDASLNDRRATSPNNPGPFRNGSHGHTSYADLTGSLGPVTTWEQGSSAGGITARAGDTLQGLAQQLWGDSSLWYKLAEANGLSDAQALTEGQTLRVPAGVMRNTFNAATTNPYDPAAAIARTSVGGRQRIPPAPRMRRRRQMVWTAFWCRLRLHQTPRSRMARDFWRQGVQSPSATRRSRAP